MKKGVWTKKEERDIEIFEFKQNWVRPQIYIEKHSLIDREGIEHLSRKKKKKTKNLID